jgi:hypothetical protein
MNQRVAYAWLSAENSSIPTNPLGILSGNSRGSGLEVGKSGRFATYRNASNGIRAAAWLLGISRYYAGIRSAIAKGTAKQQRQAIIDSPWAGGHYNNGRSFPMVAARGFLGTMTEATPMIVGEAGRETVAVLRNPRSSSIGGTMVNAPTNVTVNINGTSVRNDQDIHSLARQVAVEVERSLSRRGQMFGLRGPAV